MGRWPEIILAIFTGTVGIYALAASMQGYLIHKANLLERVVLFIAAILLIKPGILTDIIGLCGLLLVLVEQWVGRRKFAKDSK